MIATDTKVSPEWQGWIFLVDSLSMTYLNNSSAALGACAAQVAGARVWLNVADRLYQLPMSLVGVAIGVALLPRLAQSLRRGDHEAAKSAMDQGLIFGLALSLPAAAALMAMPVYLIDGLFTRGAFVAADAAATGALLFHYGWGTPAFVLQRILQPAFFAREDTKTPMRLAFSAPITNPAPPNTCRRC